MLGALRWYQNQPIPEWNEFRNLDEYMLKKRLALAENDRRMMASIPDWMDELGETELGKKWDQEIIALNHSANVYLRVNTLRTNKQSLIRKLAENDIEAKDIKGHEVALLVQKRVNLYSNPFFQQGYFEVQDIASQLVAPFMELKQGMRVVDACAGAGGKSLHIATLLQNKGKIISMDTEAWKLDELKRRAKRAGIDNIETKVIESSKTIKRMESTADRLLLDVPCSGLGVLRRNPDAKWKLQPEFIEQIRQTQQHIIQEYASMLKPGGKMVYATCSILPSENEKQVQAFLSNNKDFNLEAEHHTWPSDGMDGFYMARMVKLS
jgi:16S rRNA (cytosine967-C5)-methyltransferase